MRRHLLAASFLLSSFVAAQTAETLLLPDLLDLRLAAARAQARIGELQNEATLQTSLNNLATAAAINGIVAALQAWQGGAAPVPPGSNIEVHVVGFYEGNGAGGPNPATATVEVDRPGTAVVLVLNAYEPITWTLTQTPGTAVLAVISYSYEPQTLITAGLPGVAVVQFSYTANSIGDYFGIPEDPSDTEARFNANKWCLETISTFATTFTGDYTAPATLHQVGPANQVWLDQWVTDEAVRQGGVWNVATRAQLQAAYGGLPFLPLLTPPLFTFGPSTLVLATPLGILAPIISLPGVTSYALGTFGIYTLANGSPSTFDLGTLTSTPIAPDPLLPPFSWVESITYDLVRDRLLVATSGGVGHLYAWDVLTATWSVVTTLNNEDLGAIAYHPSYDATFAVRVNPYASVPFQLRQYDPLGTVAATQPVALPAFTGFLDDHQLYAFGTSLAYVGPAREVFGFQLRHCYVIDPLTGEVLFSSFLFG